MIAGNREQGIGNREQAGKEGYKFRF